MSGEQTIGAAIADAPAGRYWDEESPLAVCEALGLDPGMSVGELSRRLEIAERAQENPSGPVIRGQRPDETLPEALGRFSAFYHAWAEKLAEGQYPSRQSKDPESMTGWEHDRHVLIYVRNFASLLDELAKALAWSERRRQERADRRRESSDG